MELKTLTRRQVLAWVPPVISTVALPAHAETTQVSPPTLTKYIEPACVPPPATRNYDILGQHPRIFTYDCCQVTQYDGEVQYWSDGEYWTDPLEWIIEGYWSGDPPGQAIGVIDVEVYDGFAWIYVMIPVKETSWPRGDVEPPCLAPTVTPLTPRKDELYIPACQVTWHDGSYLYWYEGEPYGVKEYVDAYMARVALPGDPSYRLSRIQERNGFAYIYLVIGG